MIWNPFFPPLTPLQGLVQGLAAGGPARFPAVRATSTAETIRIEALLPGVDPADLELEVEKDELVLAGRIASGVGDAAEGVPEAAPLRRERSVGRFRRRLSLPFAVDGESATASFAEGVLRVELTRRADDGPRTITIKNTTTSSDDSEGAL